MEQRKRRSSREKMMILRELLDNKVQIGEQALPNAMRVINLKFYVL